MANGVGFLSAIDARFGRGRQRPFQPKSPGIFSYFAKALLGKTEGQRRARKWFHPFDGETFLQLPSNHYFVFFICLRYEQTEAGHRAGHTEGHRTGRQMAYLIRFVRHIYRFKFNYLRTAYPRIPTDRSPLEYVLPLRIQWHIVMLLLLLLNNRIK